MMKKYDYIFPKDNGKYWEEIRNYMEFITEVRIRVEKPILIYMKQKEVSIDQEGKIIYVPNMGKCFSYKELQKLVDYWCRDSRYAFQNEIKQGFLTIEGGHRIGICGEAVMDEQGKVQTIKYVSSVNIRLAHEIKGVAENIMEYLYEGNHVMNTLIVSPPGAGKTTLLRDVVRLLSQGTDVHCGVNVGLVDERGEIAACFQGIPQLDVGPRTDVLCQCGKKWGMRMLLRSMAPSVIAVDELGEHEEIELIQQMTGNGCAVIATIHGENMEEVQRKEILKNIWKQDIFKNMICLSRHGNQFHMELFRGKEKAVCYRS